MPAPALAVHSCRSHSLAVKTRALALSLATVYVVWGSTFLAIRVAVETLPPMLMVGVRYAVAGLLLYGFLRLRGAPAPTARQWGGAAVVALLLLVVGNGLVAWAEQSVPSNVCAVLYASVPLWVSLLSVGLGQRLRLGEWLGIGLGVVGVVVLSAGGELRANPLQALLVLVGAIGMAGGAVAMRLVAQPKGAMAPAAQLLIGGVVMGGLSVAGGERLEAVPSARSLGALAYLIVVGSLVALQAYQYVQLHARPAVATSNASVNPVVALALGALIAHEAVPPVAVGGVALIVAGLVVIARSRVSGANARAQPPPLAAGLPVVRGAARA